MVNVIFSLSGGALSFKSYFLYTELYLKALLNIGSQVLPLKSEYLITRFFTNLINYNIERSEL